jgi:DNA-binding LytR/AlgR family response regulator
MGGKYIPIFTRSETASVRKSDIIYAENHLRTVIIHTSQRKYQYYGKLSDLMKTLEKPFYSCHSNLMINFDKLRSARGSALYMEDEVVLFLGRNNYQTTRRNFSKYLIENYGTPNKSV